ncbi:MAG: aminoglycoside 3'-phosphotransferase [Chloroflexi bacterium]|nr:aminoglycoside 3'-phosphotransferase [Chloroflexota bacterium]
MKASVRPVVRVKVPAIPLSLESLVAGLLPEPISIGESSADVLSYQRDGRPVMYLKSVRARDGEALHADAARIIWLEGRAPAPRVLALAEESERTWLLTSAIPGVNGADGRLDPRMVIEELAAGLRSLHALPAAGSPFDMSLATRLLVARERMLAGVVDVDDFDDENRDRSPVSLLDELERSKPEEDLVVTHGDACLPNVMFESDRLSGFVDCGAVGVADRHQDLALAARSIESNLGARWVAPFFEAYGMLRPDSERLRYFRMLDEFF